MARIKNDERNTLLVVGLPDGGVRKCVSVFTVKNWLMDLEMKTLVNEQAGKPINGKFISELVEDYQKQLANMIDPTKTD